MKIGSYFTKKPHHVDLNKSKPQYMVSWLCSSFTAYSQLYGDSKATRRNYCPVGGKSTKQPIGSRSLAALASCRLQVQGHYRATEAGHSSEPLVFDVATGCCPSVPDIDTHASLYRRRLQSLISSFSVSFSVFQRRPRADFWPIVTIRVH